jgi:hypothetical protein
VCWRKQYRGIAKHPTNTGLVYIVDDAVTTAKILDGTILAADIAADAVTTVKIADANVNSKDR